MMESKVFGFIMTMTENHQVRPWLSNMKMTKRTKGKDVLMEKKNNQRDFLINAQDNFRESGLLTDVVIECDGGNIKAHKLILSVSSPYFFNMFNLDLAENISGRVDFKDNSYRAVKIVIQFLYTGIIPNDLAKNVDLLKEVLSISHLMQIMPLFSYCWDVYEDTLNADNFVEVFTLSQLYDQPHIFEFLRNDLTILDFRKICANVNIVDLDEKQMRYMIANMKQNAAFKYDHIVEFILKWGRNGDREKEILSALQLLDVHDLSNKPYCNLLWYASGLNKLVTNENANLYITNENEIDLCNQDAGDEIYFYSPNAIQSYNVKKKNWSDVREISNYPNNLSINQDLLILCIDHCIYFTFEKNNNFLAYDLKSNYLSLIKDPTNTTFVKNRKVIYANDVYVWNEFSFKRFNTNANSWDELEPFEADYDKSTLLSSKHGIFACRGKDIYLYNEKLDKWEYKTYLRLRSNVLDFIKNCAACQGKLYFMYSKTLYVCDVMNNNWIEIYFPGMSNVRSIPLFCEQPFLIFCDKNDRNILWKFDPENNRWEKLPKGLKFSSWQSCAMNQ